MVDQLTRLCDLITCKSLSVSSGLTSSASPAGFGSKACCSGETILQEHVEICVLSLGACPLCKPLSVSDCMCIVCVCCAVLRLTLSFHLDELFDLINPKWNFFFWSSFYCWSSTVEHVRLLRRSVANL